MASGGVVFDGLRGGVRAVVEEDGAAAEAVEGPVVDAAFVGVGVWGGEVGGFRVVLWGWGWLVGGGVGMGRRGRSYVEGLSVYVSHVSKAVPLCAGLGV